MERNEQHFRCMKEGDLSDMRSDIRMLIKDTEEDGKKIDRLKENYSSMNKIETAISLMSLSMEHMVEHNKRQDIRQEKQDMVVEKQNETLVCINQNLNELNAGQNNLSQKVANLEDRVEDNENKTKVDILDIEREKYLNYLRKYAAPFAIGSAFAGVVLQLIKIFKG